MALFCFFISAIAFLAIIHPFITYPLSLRFLPKNPIKSTPNEQLKYSLCMCAYNEEGVIEEKAKNLLALKEKHPYLEVLIYVDCASDSTAQILESYKNDFIVHVASERHGKSYGMNLLVSKAKGDIILFTDANVMLDKNIISALHPYFGDPQVGCVCGHLKYINDDEGTTAATGSLYWRLEEKIKQAESDTGSVMGADGSIFAIRKALHTPPPADIIDDMFVSFSILCQGYRIVRAPDVIAFEKSVTSSKEEFRRKVRISCQAYNVHKLLWPRLSKLDTVNLYKYISHKLLRWFGIVWIVLFMLSFMWGLVFSGLNGLAFLLCVSGIAGLWVGYIQNISPIPQILDILTSYAATGLGIVKSYQGERFQTWAPAQSIRKKA